MSFFEDRIASISIESIRNTVVGYCVAAGLKVTNWRVQGVSNQIKEAVVGAITAFSQIVPSTVRGFASLDTSVDPGDEDPFDASNADLEPDFGFLSQLGEGTFNTTRSTADFATGIATFTNVGPGSRDISPEGLIFTWTENSPPSPAPTYTNAADDVLYPGGILTVPAGTSVDIPVQCQVIGSIGTCPSGSITLTTSLTGCEATNADAIVGNDRETAETYREKCRQAPARLSLGGPSDAYSYLATKNLDGTPLLNDGAPPVPVGITRTQVSQESATGIVNAYFASGAGAAIPDDVSAANRNIEIQAFAVPDAITFTGVAATVLGISVTGTARIKARVGLIAADVAAALAAGAVAYGRGVPIGGVDQDAIGNGVIYPRDIEDAAGAVARAAGFAVYAVTITAPAATVSVPVGRVPVVSSAAINWTVTIV